MPYTFTDFNTMVGKRPRQTYWYEIQVAVNDLDARVAGVTMDSTGHVARMDNPHNVTTEQVNVILPKPGSAPVTDYPIGLTAFQIAELESSGYPSVYGIVETLYFSEHRNIQHFFDKPKSDTDAGHVYYRKWNPVSNAWTGWERLVTIDELNAHTGNADIHFTSTERDKLSKIAKGATFVEDSPSNGNIKITNYLNMVDEVNVYTHPSGDGNLHVPPTGTTNNKRVLKAGSTMGSIGWSQVQFDEIVGMLTDAQHGTRGGGSLHALVTQGAHGFMSREDKIKLDGISVNARNVTSSSINGNIRIDTVETVVYTHPLSHPASIIIQDVNNRFVTDIQIARWNDTYTKLEVDGMVGALNNKDNELQAQIDELKTSDTTASVTYLHSANNLSDVADKLAARQNLGIYASTTEPISPTQGFIWIDLN